MHRNTAYKETTAQKLVADPFAEEKHWLAACEATRKDISPLAGAVPRLRGAAVFLFVLFISATVGLLHTTMVYVGYDWGYRFVERLWGQPEEMEQALFALASLLTVILPGGFGFAFGACRVHINAKGKIWSLTPIVLPLAGAVALAVLGFGYKEHSADDYDALLGIVIWAAVQIGSMLTGAAIGSSLYAALRKRVKAPQMFLYSWSAFLVFGFFNFAIAQMSLPVEIAGYFLSILACAGIAAGVVRSKDRTAGIIAGSFATLPILLANLLNLLSGVFVWVFDLEWHAMASAIALNLVAISAVCAGGVVGHHVFGKTASRMVHT